MLPFPQTSNSGAMRQAEIANLDLDTIRRAIDDVKQHAPTTPVSLFLFVAIGTPDEIGPSESIFASPVHLRAVRQRRRRRRNLQDLADLEIDGPHGDAAHTRP